MVDFKYFLNKQGPKGAQGDKGEQGFSPYISVGTNTASEFTLLVTNEYNSFETPNLRGDQIDDQGGTYVRYNQETDAMYAGNPDYANTDTYGMVKIADDESISTGASDRVITAEQLQDAIENVTTTIPSVYNGVLTITDGENILGTFSANQSNDVTITTGSSSATPNDGVLTIQKNGSNIGTFSADSSTNTTVNIQVPTQVSDLSDGSTLVTTTALSNVLSDYVKATTLSTVATSGNYNDLSNKPTIPTVNNGTLTINYGTTAIGTFTANQAGDVTANIPVAEGYTLNPATTTSLGGIIVGNNLSVDENGVLSADAQEITVDTTISSISTNPVQNKVIYTALGEKQDTITDLQTIRTGAGEGATAVQPGDLATVATSGDYNDLTNKPTIDTVYDTVITINYGATEVGSFTLNQSSAETITIPESSNPVATTTSVGVVQPDGSTITVDANGVISANISGGAEIDDTTTSTTKVWSSAKTNEAIQDGDLAVIETIAEGFLGSDSVSAGNGINVSTTTTTQTTSTSTTTVTALTIGLNTCTTPATTTSTASATSPAVIVENYVNGTSWYRVWSDGWCEQGGVIVGNVNTNTQVNLLKNFANTNYHVLATYNTDSTGATGGAPVAANAKTTSSFAIGSMGGGYAWFAYGYTR